MMKTSTPALALTIFSAMMCMSAVGALLRMSTATSWSASSL